MGAPPLVSVVMPVYNGEQFLREAVESILNQTFRDFEFVIINDGSTDGSAAILEGYATTNARIRLVQRENQGLISSLNEGCGLAVGKYICRMDADDISMPERLHLQVTEMEKRPALGVLGGRTTLIDCQGKRLQNYIPPETDADIKRTLMDKGNCLSHSAVIMRREAFRAAGGYRTAFCHAEDYDLWLRMVEHVQAANLEAEVLHYRVHPGQVSSLQAVQQVVSAMGARVSARLRRTTGRDPFDGAPLVTPELLMDLGVSREEIGRTVYSRVMSVANARMAEGAWAAAVPLLVEAEKATSCYRLPAADYATAWAMYAAASRRLGLDFRSAAWLLWKACRHPWAVAAATLQVLRNKRWTRELD